MPVAVLSAQAVRPLRQLVLRPHQTVDELVYEGDDHPLGLHVGSLRDGAVVGVASIAPQPWPAAGTAGDWRLRGMAVLPGARRTGSGRELLQACLEHVRAHDGRRVWCNARIGAVGFYERAGFVVDGNPFEVQDIGTHVRMTRST